jgi:hypothetical protein
MYFFLLQLRCRNSESQSQKTTAPGKLVEKTCRIDDFCAFIRQILIEKLINLKCHEISILSVTGTYQGVEEKP